MNGNDQYFWVLDNSLFSIEIFLSSSWDNTRKIEFQCLMYESKNEIKQKLR